jgi:FkbM family methyltransferase
MAEFAAALRAVDLARDRFTMIELGCGWGCWMTNTGVAAKRRGLAIRLIGVEGDEGHLAFAREALATNGIAAEEYALFRGAAGAAAGVALFPRQSQSGEDWGLEPEFAPTLVKRGLALATGRYRELPVIALVDIIGDEDEISLLHMDIQGGEADLVRDSLQTLTRKVAYLVIGTHSRAIEGRLMTLLLDAGWALEVERPSIFEITPKGPAGHVKMNRRRCGGLLLHADPIIRRNLPAGARGGALRGSVGAGTQSLRALDDRSDRSPAPACGSGCGPAVRPRSAAGARPAAGL